MSFVSKGAAAVSCPLSASRGAVRGSAWRPDYLERAPVAERDLAQQCRGESLGADTTAL